MFKRITNYVILIVSFVLFASNVSAQLNETFDNLRYGVPNGWDNSDYVSGLEQWSYYASGFNGTSAVACQAVDGSQKGYAILKTPALSNLPAGCQLSFNVNAPAQIAQMSVSLKYGAKEFTLGKVQTKGWTELSYDLSAYAGYTVTICFRIDCGGKGSYATEWCIVDNVKVATKPNCARPIDLSVMSVNQNKVSLIWSMSKDGAKSPDFDLVVKDLKTNTNVFNQTIVTEDYMYEVEGLTPSTNYEVVLKTNCSASGQGISDFATVKFTTLCPNQNLPYSHSFDGWNTLPDCWLGSKSGVSVQEAIKIGTSAVKLTSTNSSEAYLISPQLNKAANNIEIGMSVYGKKGTKYSIFLTPDPTDMSQAIPLWENIEIQKNNEWDDLTFNTLVTDLTDVGMAVVVFMPSGVDATMYVDNIKFSTAPTCPKLESLREIVSDSTFTTIDWNEYIEVGNYEVLVSKDSIGKSQVADRDSVITISKSYNVNSHPCTIDGLDKNKAYTIKVRAICSENDTSKWSSSISIHTSCGSREDAIFFEGFESGIFPPECWFSRQTIKPTPTSGLSSGIDYGDETWTLGKKMTGGYDEIHDGKYSAKLRDTKAGIHTILVTQPIYVDIPTHYDLSLWVYRDAVYAYAAKEHEGLNIWVNNRPDTIGGTKLGFINSIYTMYPIEEQEGWYQYEYNIPLAGNVYIIFEGVSGGSYGTFIDDVEVKLAPLCRKVSDIKLSDITTNSVKLSWTKGLNESKWNVRYTLVSGQHEISNAVVVEGNPELDITSLSPGAQYTINARVVSNCGADDMGEPVEFTQKFETDCDAISMLPYIQTFDEERFPPHCWRQYQSQAYGNPNDMFASDYGDAAWMRNDDKFWNPELIKSGAASAKLQASSAGIKSALVTPQFTFASGKEYVVSFWFYRMPEPKDMDNTSAVDNEGLNILVNDQPNVDNATKLGYINVGSQFAPKVEQEGWYKYEFTITASGNKYVILEGVHQGTMAMYIDNVVIREKTSCDYMDVKIDSIKTNVARVTNLTSDVDVWQVSVGLPGFNPNTGNLFDATGSSVTITDLTPQTDYELYARRKCADGTYGPWSEFVLQFSTQCAPIVVDFDNPFFEGFENFTVDEYVFGCYQQVANVSAEGIFSAKTETYNDDGVITMTPYEGSMFAALPYNNDTWLFRPFYLKANSNYEVTVMARQDCDFGMNLSLAYFIEPEVSMLVDTMVTQELVSDWREYKGWINAPEDGVYYIGINTITWGISVQQNNSVIDNFSVKEIECAPPVQIKESKITAKSAEVDFHSIADVWEVKVASVNFDPEYGVADIAHDTIREKHYEINGLQTNKEYYYSFRSLCAEPSEWSHVKTFRTICSTFELPYYDNFEDPELNNIVCWSSNLTNEYTSKSEPSNYVAYSGRVSFKMYESMTILPEFNVSSLANYLVKGYVHASKDNAHISVGVVKDIANPLETFESVADVIVRKSYEWSEFIAYLSDLAKPDFAEFADAKYIAFVVGNGTEFFIDDLEVIEIPTCLSPTEVYIENVTTNSCEIRWYENGSATKWQVNGYYKSELVVDTIVTTNPATILGLNPASTYNFEIRAICSDVDKSWWSKAGEVTTECASYGLPYDQTFIGTEHPQCWKQGLAYPNKEGNYWVHTTDAYYYKQPYDVDDYNQIVYLKDYTSMVVSPIISLKDVSDALLSFDLYNENSGNIRILLSKDGGTNFDIVLGSGYTSMTDTMSLHFNLSEYVGNDICVGIEATSSGFAGSFVLIDNFSIEEVQNCKRPVDTKLIVAYDTFAKFTLNDTTLNSKWQYVIGQVGFDPNKATPVSISSKNFEIQGLNPLSNYEVYVRAVCGPNAYSDWRGPLEFQTACLMDVDFPYYEGFEGITSLSDNCFKLFSFKSLEDPYPTAELNTRTYVSAGTQGLVLVSSPNNCMYFALPLMSKPLRELKISFDYRNEYDNKPEYAAVATSLELGVMADLNVEQSYTRLVELPFTSIHGFESYFYSFADADAKIDLSDKYIVFRYNKTPNKDRTAIWAGLDNIEIVPSDYCYTVDGLVVSERLSDGATLTWNHENSSVTAFEYRLLSNNIEIKTGTVTTPSVSLTDLLPATNYQFEVRCQCSADNYSDWKTLNFRTLAYAPTLPYVLGFEDEESSNWVYCGEGQTNYFVVGEDKLGVKSGNKALYITNDGQLNQYSIGSTSSSYVYRLFDFEPGQYTISYSWKCVGERTDAYNADYGKVYLAPVDKDIVAGKRISSYMDAVSGCIMLSNDNKGLNVSSKWNDVVVDVVFDKAVKYNLVIEWYNNASGGAQTPLAIDDISVRKVNCPMPESLKLIMVDDVNAKIAINTISDADTYEYRLCKSNDVEDYLSIGSSTTKTIELTTLTPATDYYLFVRSVCGEDESSNYQSIAFRTEKAAAVIPYTSDFSSADENSQWVIVNGNQKNGFVIGGDSKSLYVTSEPQNGETAVYGYDSKIETAAYAYRLFNFEKGQYAISYDWKSEGSKLDYGRVFLVPASYEIEAGKRIGNVNVTTYVATLPVECIALDGGILSGKLASNHAENPFFISEPGRYKLVVQWYNKGDYTGTLPLWLDNVEVNKESCAVIDELKVIDSDYQSVTATFKNYNESAIVCAISTSNNVDLAFATDTIFTDTISFEGLNGSTTYYLFAKAQCYENIASEWQMISFTTDCSPIEVTEANPYFEGFENYLDETNLDNCWTTSYKHEGQLVYVSSDVDMGYNAYAMEGVKYLTLANGNNTANVSRQFLLEGGVYYCISVWSVMTPVADKERGRTTIQLKNGTEVLAEQEVSAEKYCEVRRVFVPRETGVYDLGFTLNVGLSVVNASVDNFKVEVLKFGAPDQLEVDSIAKTSAQISWVGLADRYQVQLYKETELLVDTKTQDLSYTFNNLSPATTYRVRVRGIIDSPLQESDWIEIMFTTDCDVALPTFTQNFENTASGSIPVCWDNMSETSLADNTKNWSVKAESGNKSVTVNTSELYGTAVLLSPMIFVEDNTILSYSYRNLTHTDKLKVEVRGAGTRQFSDVILDGGHSGWQQKLLELSAYEGDTIQLAFIVDAKANKEGGIIGVDDMRIACYAGEKTDKVSVCQGEGFVGYGFSVSSNELFVGVNTFTKFVTSNNCDTLKHLEVTVNPMSSSHTYDTICRGDVYMWGDIACIETNVYEVWYRGKSSCGCDSVAYLHLEVLDLRENIYKTICEGESYKFGNSEYSETGIYVDTIPNPGSCDSIKILTLVVIPTTYESSMTICQSEPLEWNDTLLTTSGRYERIYSNANGCDSIEILNLTVLPTFTELNASICQGSSYLFGARELTEAGVYVDSMVNVLGCDSIITLNLVVNEPAHGVFEDYVCEGYEYVGFGFKTMVGEIMADTVLYRTVKTIEGCDSIVELHVEFVPTAHIDTIVTILEGEYYEFGEKTLTSAGQYKETFITSLGCDSIVNLTLEVVTGVDNVYALPLTIVPNPIGSGQATYVNREFTAEEQRGLRIEVVNSLGQIIAMQYPTQYPIAVSGIDVSGLYYIRVITGTGDLYVGKLIVK